MLSDDNGINATGNGIGHNLELVIDNSSSTTYNLNDNFAFDFGSYTSGSTWYSIPELEPGQHTLLFRAWDSMNNASTATLDFNVVKGLVPTIFSVALSHNPATTSTTFIINHNFTGCALAVTIDVFDMSGRLLWTHSEMGTSETNNYTIDWDLSTENGGRLQTASTSTEHVCRPTAAHQHRRQRNSSSSTIINCSQALMLQRLGNGGTAHAVRRYIPKSAKYVQHEKKPSLIPSPRFRSCCHTGSGQEGYVQPRQHVGDIAEHRP